MNNYQDIPKSIFVITIVIIALSSPYLIASGSNNRILAQDTGKKSVSVNYLDKHLPVNLSVASTGSNSSHIFIFGGTNDLWIGTDGIYLLDTQTFTSTRIGSLPAPAYGMGTVQIDNLVYLIGGFSNGTSLDSILCFNIDTLSFEQVNSVLPRGLEGPIVVEISGKIYIFCGLTFNVGFSDQV
ncbi:MAG: Kelch repeat-containing protein, partial [Candidatus Hodarchaeales archaeon]